MSARAARRRASRACLLAACCVASAPAHRAAADLAGEMRDVREGLARDRALVAPRPPVFLEAGATTVVEPTKVLSSGDACVTLVVLGAPTTHFTVARGPSSEAADDLFGHLRQERDPRREESTEGLYVRTACNAETRELERVAIRMRSPRGALETLVARSAAPPSSLESLAAARAPGPSAPPADPGPALVPLPFEARKKRVVERERALGATDVVSVAMSASETGAGELDLKVSAGCHAFDVMSAKAGGLDLDADLRDASSGALLASDQGEAPDAHLETCVPEIQRLAIGFTGAGASSEVTVSDAVFAWPRWITERWAARVAATWANLARRRKTPEPALPPIAETLGAQGRAITPVAVEPGRCYLASVAVFHGRSRGLRLIASASRKPSIEESGPSGEGASVVFCSEDQDVARVEVDAPTSNAWWVLSVWPLGGGDRGEP